MADLDNTLIRVPTMSSKGFIITLGERVDTLLAYFFGSDYNQSDCYPEDTVTFQLLMEEYNNKPTELAIQTENALRKYFRCYFNIVEIKVEVDDPLQTKYKLNIQIDVGDGNSISSAYRKSQDVHVHESQFKLLIDNNNGD